MEFYGMNAALFVLWLVLFIAVIDGQKYLEDPDIIAINERSRQQMKRYLERKALGGFEIIPLQINGKNISEELRDLMEREVIRRLGLPADFEDFTATEPTVPVAKRSGTSTVASESSEQMNEGPLNYPRQVGSIKGIPGEHFPDYTDIPITSFSCADKPHLPGFYADLDTGCQVFHACWNDRRETFLCPMGTTFNQALLACDYWYSSNCSLAPHYYNVNDGKQSVTKIQEKEDLLSMIDAYLGSKTDKSVNHSEEGAIPASVLSFVTHFMPVKAKVTFYPESEGQPSKIVASASVGKDKIKHKTKSPKDNKVSSIKGGSPIQHDGGSSEIPAWCLSIRHFAYRLNEKLNEIRNLCPTLVNNYGLEVVINIQNFLRYLDPEFYKFDIAGANYDADKRIKDFVEYLSLLASELFQYEEVINRPHQAFNYTSSAGDYGLAELIRYKIEKILSVLDPQFNKSVPEKANDSDDRIKDDGASVSSSTSKYDGLSTTTPVAPVTSKSVKEVPRCKKPKCESVSKPTLTPLNPRFITKPLAGKTVVDVKEPLPPGKQSVKKSFARAKSLLSSSSKKVTVSEETKKALLLNYMKLLKINGKRSNKNDQ